MKREIIVKVTVDIDDTYNGIPDEEVLRDLGIYDDINLKIEILPQNIPTYVDGVLTSCKTYDHALSEEEIQDILKPCTPRVPEHAVGETFTYGNIKLKVVSDTDCYKCYFSEKECGYKAELESCVDYKRLDETDVQFEEVY